MSNLIGRLRIALGLDSAAFDSGLDEARRKLSATAKQMEAVGGRLQGLGQSLSIGLTVPLTALATGSVMAARRQEQAVAAVEAALKSMGDVAGFTSGQLQEMASNLQAQSLFGDEVILERVTANLLTFGNISGEVFERAQQAALDLSARLGTDLQASALQVGKALNDPIRGVSALAEVGVAFTEQQREQIKAMVEAGDVAQAQAVILSELERQYSGQAAALAATDSGQITQALNSLGDASEKIGAVLLPIIADLAQFVAGLADKFAQLDPRVQTFIVAGGALAAALGPVLVTIGGLVAGIGAFLPVIAAVASPVGLAAAAIIGLGVAAVALYRNWDDVVAKVAEIRDALAAMGERIKQAFLDALRGIVDGVAQIFEDMKTAIRDKVTGLVEEVRGLAGDIATGLRDGISSRARAVSDAASGMANRLISATREALESNSPSRVFMRIGGDVVDGLVEGIRINQDAAVRTAAGLGQAVGRAAASTASNALDGFFRDLATGKPGGAFKGLFDSLGDSGRGLFGDIVSGAFKSGGGGFSAIGGALAGSFRGVASSIGSLLSGGGLGALSGVIGSALPIVGAVSGLVNLVKGFSSTRTVGSGIRLGVSGGEIAGGNFERVQRSRFWGLSRRRFDRDSAFGDEMSAAFGAQLAGVQDSVRATFDRLGVQVSDAALRGVDVGLRKIDTSRLSEAQVAARIEEVFGEYADGLAKSLGGITFEAARTLADVAGILEPAGQLFFGSIRSMAAAAGDLARLAGGTDELARSVGTFAELFFSDAEKLDVVKGRVAEVFRELRIGVPATADAFKELVLSQNLMTASGRRTYAALLEIAPAFRAVSDAAEAAAQAAAEASAAAAEAAQRAAEQAQRAAIDVQRGLVAEQERALEALRDRLAGQFDLSAMDYASAFEARLAQAAEARGLSSIGGVAAPSLAPANDPQIVSMEALLRKQVEILERLELYGIPGRP